MTKIKGFKRESDQWGTEFISAEGAIEGEARLSGWMVEAMSLRRGGWRIAWDWWAGDEYLAKEVVTKDRGVIQVTDSDLRVTLRRLVKLMQVGKSPAAEAARCYI